MFATDGDSLLTQVDPSVALVALTGLGALTAVAVDGVWRWARNVVTIVHEAGHAVAALATGRQLTGIRLHSDTSGLTVSRGRPRGLGMVVTTMAGYPSPALVGLIGVVLLAAEQVTLMLWAGTIVLAGMLLMVRNLYGVFLLVTVAAVVLGVSVYAAPDVQAAFGYAMTWFLLFGAVRPIVELQRHRRRPGAVTDADQLAGLTRLPAVIWVVVFGVVNLGSLLLGGWLLLA
jgi:hypothetical protein